MMNHALIALVLVCGACRAAIPPVPGQGGPAWLELTSDHFIVWTDGSPEAGQQLIRVLEHMRQIMFGVSVFNPTSNAKAFVIAMRNKYEVRPYVPENIAALAVAPHYPLYQPTILLSIEGLDYDRTMTIHELAHVISYNALSAQPHWFAEGLAGYYDGGIAPETARSLAAAHPDDWRAWLLVEVVVKHGPEAEAAHAQLCRLVVTAPAILPRDACSTPGTTRGAPESR